MAERCDTDKSIMIRVSKVSVAANVFLSAFKLFAGVVGHSGAMIADAVHSLSDVAGSGLVILGAHLSSKESDREHQYGHERLECVISLILANVLLLVAAGIGIEGIRGMIDPQSAVLVYAGGGKENRLCFTDGGGLASPLRRYFLCGQLYRNFRSDAGFSRTAAGSLCFDRCARFQGGNRYLPGDDE